MNVAKIVEPDPAQRRVQVLLATHTRHEVAARVDQVSPQGELDCATVADSTHGAVDFLEACRQVGRPVVIVSNNAEPAIEAFLDRHDLRHLVHAIVGRVPARPELKSPTRTR